MTAIQSGVARVRTSDAPFYSIVHRHEVRLEPCGMDLVEAEPTPITGRNARQAIDRISERVSIDDLLVDPELPLAEDAHIELFKSEIGERPRKFRLAPKIASFQHGHLLIMTRVSDRQNIYRVKRYRLSLDQIDSLVSQLQAEVNDLSPLVPPSGRAQIDHAHRAIKTFRYAFFGLLISQQTFAGPSGEAEKARFHRCLEESRSNAAPAEIIKLASQQGHVVVSGMSEAKEGNAEAATSFDAIIARAYLHGIETLTREELQQLEDGARAQRRLAKFHPPEELQQRAIAEKIAPLARSLFPEIESDGEVTAERLTKLFAIKSQADEGIRHRLSGEEQDLVIHLVRSWRENVGGVKFRATPATVVKFGQKGLRFRGIGAGQPILGTTGRFPAIEFIEKSC